jgi:hypothetical protein
MELKEWAKFQESLLRSQLKVIREFLRAAEPEQAPRPRRTSQIGIVYDILTEAREPMHLTEIIRRAKSDFNVEIEPGSIVSALTKKVNSGRMFRRVGPSTFEILEVSQKTP